MTPKHPPLGDRTQKPGPGSHYPEKVFLCSKFCTELYFGELSLLDGAVRNTLN